MSECPGDPNCICKGTGIVTRLLMTADSGNTGPEICDCVAKKTVEEVQERLLHPFLIQAVALECDRLPVDPATGPSDEDLSRVEAEVRQEIERAFALAAVDEEADDE